MILVNISKFKKNVILYTETCSKFFLYLYLYIDYIKNLIRCLSINYRYHQSEFSLSRFFQLSSSLGLNDFFLCVLLKFVLLTVLVRLLILTFVLCWMCPSSNQFQSVSAFTFVFCQIPTQ